MVSREPSEPPWRRDSAAENLPIECVAAEHGRSCESLRNGAAVSYKRYVVAGLVMAGGVVAAWPFRHNGPTKPHALAVNHDAPDPTWSLPQDLTLQVHPQPGLSPAPELTTVQPTQTGRLARPASFNAPGNEPPLESLPAPPFLPMAYESLLVPVGSEQNSKPLKMASQSSAPVHEPLLPPAPEPGAVEEKAKPGPLWRKHRIVEGDTLVGLAQRYLGDAGRAGEIHVANLDRLASPEILPLGVTLLIPPRVDLSKSGQ